MKEEEYRDPLVLGLIRGAGKAGGQKRYKISDIIGFTDLYSANPGGTAGVGQLVFAFRQGCGCHGGYYTLMGECAAGCTLMPYGVACYYWYCTNPNPAGVCCANCTTCGFNFGTGTYVALGSVMCGGGTLWRRIS